jgi:hypothetical protein
MASLAELQSRLDALREVRATGAKVVIFRSGAVEHRVEYQTDAEIAAAIADLERQISAASGGGVKVVRFATSKGL